MNALTDSPLIYAVIFVILLVAELLYFKIADRYNIIDKPNERSSHTRITLRGGGVVIFAGAWIWAAFYGIKGHEVGYVFDGILDPAAGGHNSNSRNHQRV